MNAGRDSRDRAGSSLLDGDGVLVALGALCSTLFVAAVATTFVSGGRSLLVVLAWVGLVSLVCLAACGARLRRRG